MYSPEIFGRTFEYESSGAQFEPADTWMVRGSVARVNLALSGLPVFAGADAVPLALVVCLLGLASAFGGAGDGGGAVGLAEAARVVRDGDEAGMEGGMRWVEPDDAKKAERVSAMAQDPAELLPALVAELKEHASELPTRRTELFGSGSHGSISSSSARWPRSASVTTCTTASTKKASAREVPKPLRAESRWLNVAGPSTAHLGGRHDEPAQSGAGKS